MKSNIKAIWGLIFSVSIMGSGALAVESSVPEERVLLCTPGDDLWSIERQSAAVRAIALSLRDCTEDGTIRFPQGINAQIQQRLNEIDAKRDELHLARGGYLEKYEQIENLDRLIESTGIQNNEKNIDKILRIEKEQKKRDFDQYFKEFFACARQVAIALQLTNLREDIEYMSSPKYLSDLQEAEQALHRETHPFVYRNAQQNPNVNAQQNPHVSDDEQQAE